MHVALTGAVGFVGSHVLMELQEHGHEVTALVRDETQRTPSVPAAQRRPSSISMTRSAVVSLLRNADGVITPPVPVTPPARGWTQQLSTRHRSARRHRKAYCRSAPLGLRSQLRDHRGITVQCTSEVAWKEPIERRVLGAKGIRVVVPISGVPMETEEAVSPAYSRFAPRRRRQLGHAGTWTTAWPTVHVADLAGLLPSLLGKVTQLMATT